MKKITLLVFAFCFQIVQAQEYTVEKSIFSVQVGAFGGWINNESRLGNQFTLKSEIGLDFFDGSSDGISFDALSPVITVEPRWYYNLEKRGNKGRNVQNNGGNFLALTVSYHPDWFIISQYDDMIVPHQIAIIPKWGIKRNFGKSNFNYEVGIGLGLNYRFLKHYGFYENDTEVLLDTHLRIGYTFKTTRNK
jgi:hypothetical protein